MLGHDDPNDATSMPPPELRGVSPSIWTELVDASRSSDHSADFMSGFANGRAFYESNEALAQVRPRVIEWTGGRRSLGDEMVPADLRVNHVYLVSCKYLSRVLHNRSPAQLVLGLLGTGAPRMNQPDWFLEIAPEMYEDLYAAVRRDLVDADLPDNSALLKPVQRRDVALRLRRGWGDEAAVRYRALCDVVSSRTAQIWSENIATLGDERMLWRLLRIGPAPYFFLGSDRDGPARFRVDTPWDWRQRFRLLSFEVFAQAGGQARIGWRATVRELAAGSSVDVDGHVEVRWSHGRFGQPPEAKVYLDTPHRYVPGYNAL
jgi:hypothetical protein